MKFSKFSNEVVAELLVFLAKNEDFSSIKSIKSIQKKDVVEVLQELSDYIQHQSQADPIVRKSSVSSKQLGSKTTQVIAKLTPQEENQLLKSFKID